MVANYCYINGKLILYFYKFAVSVLCAFVNSFFFILETYSYAPKVCIELICFVNFVK